MKRVSICLLLIVFMSATAWAAPPRGKGPLVACINPGWKGDQFWIDTDEAMSSAARNLGVRLRFYAASRPPDVIAFVHRLAVGPDRPDYIVTTTQKGIGTHLLEATEQAKIPTFIFNSGLLDVDRRRVGGPRHQFKYWIGEMLPHEEEAGHKLANLLIDVAVKAKRNGPDGRVRVLALSGTETDAPVVLRVRGLKRALAERHDADLLQIVGAHWDYAEAKHKMALINQRYPNADVLWSANDRMALGAMETLRAKGREPGRDIMVGGMDWDARALAAVKRGQMVASIDGQTLEGAWVMVLLFDYYHGRDFATERTEWHSEMTPVTRSMVTDYTKYLGAGRWEKLDFRRFSKVYNPKLKTYRFSIEDLIASRIAAEARGRH